MTYDSTITLAEIVADRPGRSRFFERLGLDYCCGGKRPLGEVCAEKGLDATSVLSSLAAFEEAAGSSLGEIDLAKASNREIIDHILERHHRYLRAELPRLAGLSAKVLQAHGEREPRLADIAFELGSLRRGLEEHLQREEQDLFPLISSDSFPTEAQAQSVAGYEHEHEETGASLKRLSELSDRYTAPEWACNTFRAFYDGLRELEADIHEHVHEENNILFSRLRAGS